MGPTTQAVMFQMTPVLGALIGIVTTLIIVAVVIVFIVRTRERGDDSASTAGSQGTASTKNTTGVAGDIVNGENDDDKNPDVVPNKAGEIPPFLVLVKDMPQVMFVCRFHH